MVKNLSTTYDAAGLPTSASDAATGETITYAHDQVGNLSGVDSSIAANDWTYAYDAFSRLTCAVQGSTCASGSTRVLFTLDALDRALTRVKGSSTTSLTYQGIGEQVAKTVNGATTTTYVSGGSGGPLAEKTGSTASFHLRDPHGDVVGLVSTTAANQGTASFDPWGRGLATTGQTSFLGYQGDMTDPDSKQVDMGTRWYAAGLGRFSSRDVLFGELTSPMTLNQHVYGGLNPVTMWDPTGMGQCSMAVGGCRTTTKNGTVKAVGGNPGDPDHPMHDQGSAVVSSPTPPRPEPPRLNPPDPIDIDRLLAGNPIVGDSGERDDLYDDSLMGTCGGSLQSGGSSADSEGAPDTPILSMGPGCGARIVSAGTRAERTTARNPLGCSLSSLGGVGAFSSIATCGQDVSFAKDRGPGLPTGGGERYRDPVPEVKGGGFGPPGSGPVVKAALILLTALANYYFATCYAEGDCP